MAGIPGMGRPQNIQTPNQFDINNVAQVPEIAPMKAPAESVPMAPAQPSLDDIFAAPAQPSLDDIFADEAVASDSDFDSTPPTFSETIENLPARFEAGIAKTTKEKKFVLDRRFGAENVRDAGDGDFEIKKADKWKKFDPGDFGWDLLGDVADFSRDAIEEIGASAGTAAGIFAATGSSVASGGVALPAAPAVVVASRAAGNVGGMALADAYQAFLGIPRDPDRSALQEYSMGATLGVVAGELGDFVGRKIADRSSRVAAERLMKSEDVAMSAARDVVEASDALKANGLIKNVDGFDVAILPSQAALLNPDAQAAAKELAGTKKFQNFVLKQGEMINDAFAKISDSVSTYTGKRASVGEKFAERVDDIDAVEGKLIGSFREKVLKEAGDGEIPILGLREKVVTMAEGLGFRVNAQDKLITPTVDEVIEKTGLSKEGAELITKRVAKLNEEIYNAGGRVPMKRIDTLYREISAVTNNLYKRGEGVDKAYRSSITQLKDAIRDDYTKAIGTILGESDKGAYQESLKRFSSIKGSIDDLKSVLKTDQISANALASSLFSKGKESLGRIRAAKNILRDEPDLWKDISGHYLTDVVAKNTDLATKKTNWTQVSKSIKGLGDEVVTEMFGASKGDLDNFIKYAAAVEKGTPELAANPGNTQLVKNTLLSVRSIFAAASAGMEFFARIDKDKKIAQFISKNGIDTVTRGLPKAEASQVRRFAQKYADYLAPRAAAMTIRRSDETANRGEPE